MSSFESSRPIEPGSGSDATVSGDDFAESSRPEPVPAAATLTCPGCGYTQPPTDECLKCGLVVAKYRPRERPPEPAAPETRSHEEIAADLAEQGYEPRTRQADAADVDEGFFAPERKGLAKGMLGGLVMMAIAVVWFGLGWMAGYIFFYPPILFVIGLFGFLKGLFSGDVAGA